MAPGWPGTGWRVEATSRCPLDEIAPGVVQGYSPVLDLIIRWDHGQLVWIDPATNAPILTYEDQRDRADAEREARIRAEARVRELEDEMRRLRGEGAS